MIMNTHYYHRKYSPCSRIGFWLFTSKCSRSVKFD